MALRFAKSYVIPLVVSPSTLTSGTVYFSIRNGGSEMIYLKSFAPTVFFTGVVGVGVSLFNLQRGVATPSGGATITPVKNNTAQLDGGADARFADAGLTASISGGQIFKQFGQPNQAVITIPPVLRFEDENLFGFAPGECLLIVAQNGLTAGVRLACDFVFYEGEGF